MSTSSINVALEKPFQGSSRSHTGPGSLLGASLLGLILLAGCAPKQALDFDPDQERTVSRYAEDRVGGVAGESDAEHVPPVPHDPAVRPMAEEAIEEYFRALQAIRQDDLGRALVMLQSLSARYPMLSGPFVNQGIIYLKQEKYDDAEDILREALSTNEQNPYAHNTLGVVLREQGDFEQALKHYRRAVELDPRYARAHFNIGVLAELYLQDLNLALQHFRRYQDLQREPDQTVGNWIADLERRAPSAPAPSAARTESNDTQPGDEAVN